MAETILPLLLKYRISSVRNSKANMNEPIYGEAYLYLTSTFKKNTFVTISSELQIHQIGYLEPSFLLNRLSVNWPRVISWLLAARFWPVACGLLWKVKGTGPTQWPLSPDTPFGEHRRGAWKCLRLQPGKGVFLGQGRPGVIRMQPFSWGRKHLFFFFLKGTLFIYLFILAVLGLRFCVRAFSSCGKRGPLFIVVRGHLTIAASLVVEHRLQTRRLSSCGSRA